MAGGEKVVPAVVVFGDPGEKGSLMRYLKYHCRGPAVNAIIFAREIVYGQPRTVLHCKESKLLLVQSLVGLISSVADAPLAIVHKWMNNKTDSRVGVEDKSRTCKFYGEGVTCPWGLKGPCLYHCYEDS
jgi:hypothetical protein